MTGALAALSIVRAAMLLATTSGAWERVQIGASPVSMQMPGKLLSQPRNQLPEEGDWVRTVEEFVYSDDNVFVMASVFAGAEGTKVADHQLLEAMSALIFGIASADEKLTTQYTASISYDGNLARRRRLAIGPADGAFYADLLVVAVGHRLVAVVTVAVTPQDPVSARILGTLRVGEPGR
ncbi:MAG: hypothetical protein AB7F50_07355 [Fimbriimonadaceae bacterium]